jgi:hypothetical protein
MGNDNDSLERFNKICDNVSKIIVSYSPQLFSVKDHKSKLPPAADSSSILVTIENRFFLVTAAHCIHEFDLTCIGIMILDEFVGLGGTVQYFEPNGAETFDPNNMDMAVFELDAETTAAMKEKYQFLDWNQIKTGHPSLKISPYLIFGYPGSKTRKHFPTKQIIPEPFILRTIGKPFEFYQTENIDPQKTLALLVDQKRIASAVTKEVEKIEELGGISGCGVWHISNLLAEYPTFELISILTGENKEKAVLYSSKVDNLRTILIRAFGVISI